MTKSIIAVEVEAVTVEWDEDGCELHVTREYDGYTHRFRITDPEALYDTIKASVLPWLMERDAAKVEYDRAKRAGDTRSLTDEEFSAYVDDAYGDDWSKRVGMEQMREQGYA